MITRSKLSVPFKTRRSHNVPQIRYTTSCWHALLRREHSGHKNWFAEQKVMKHRTHRTCYSHVSGSHNHSAELSEAQADRCRRVWGTTGLQTRPWQKASETRCENILPPTLQRCERFLTKRDRVNPLTPKRKERSRERQRNSHSVQKANTLISFNIFTLKNLTTDLWFLVVLRDSLWINYLKCWFKIKFDILRYLFSSREFNEKSNTKFMSVGYRSQQPVSLV